MTRSTQESPVPETGTPGLRWRGLETAYGEPTRARSWKRRTQPRGAYGAPHQSSTLLRSPAPVHPDPLPGGTPDLGLQGIGHRLEHPGEVLVFVEREVGQDRAMAAEHETGRAVRGA